MQVLKKQNNLVTVRAVDVKNVDFGSNITIVEPVNLYSCKIGNNSYFATSLLSYFSELFCIFGLILIKQKDFSQ